MRKGADIAERLMGLAMGAVDLAGRLPKTVAGRHVAGQLIRSGTAGGANYEEARAAESREDFAHKVGIAAKEVRESAYWLAFIERTAWIKEDLSSLIDEADSLSAILSASKRTASTNARPAPPG